MDIMVLRSPAVGRIHKADIVVADIVGPGRIRELRPAGGQRCCGRVEASNNRYGQVQEAVCSKSNIQAQHWYSVRLANCGAQNQRRPAPMGTWAPVLEFGLKTFTSFRLA